MADLHPIPSLSVNRRRATLLLVVMAALWLILLFTTRMLPQHAEWLGILTTGAEAGVVGGLADWYAITVLFRDPFKHIWTPKIIRDHTEIIPRNKARIADSMGRFVQENFLAPHIVRQKVEERDIMKHVATWLAQPENAKLMTHEFQRFTPRVLKIFQNRDIEQFMQSNLLDWLDHTSLNQPIARTLKAIFDNQIHHDVIQLTLDTLDSWITNHPVQTREILQKVLDETGLIGYLSRGVSLFGFDLKKQTIDGILRTLRQLQANPEHAIRLMINHSIMQWMLALQDDDSVESRQLEAMKQDLIHNPTMTGFVMHVINSIRQAIIDDLEANPSAIGLNLEGLAQRLGVQLERDPVVRGAINHELALLAEYAADRYANTVIDYVREQIEGWDTTMMIEKIESEVGGDLHMIRINGVVVGCMIGLVLGTVRLLVEG
jgi:uncharacterized membrane-anchored protein YjiN (DUF445 family)